MNTILIDKDFRKTITQFLSANRYSKITVIVDENTQEHCYDRLHLASLLPSHHVILIKSGEKEKNLRTCEYIWQEMTAFELDRKSLVINLGGGVIGDMGGFCASTYKRGIDFIQVPTTLLAMVDASVGGKLGVDFQQYKNHIGVFRVPNAVLISTDFLQTLPARELRSGFAEVVKHCLIADAKKWEKLKSSDWKTLDFEEIVRHSIAIKDKITESDPTEKGLRKILNFGHTLGHAVESFYLETKERLFHGEAIAIGMICEAYLSYVKGHLSETDLRSVTSFLKTVYGKASIPNSVFNDIIELTKQDKKNQYGEIQFALIGPLGQCKFDVSISPEEMYSALVYYAQC